MSKQMTGARMVIQALKDQGVEVVFGYPGGAVLPIYDEMFQQNDIRHILVRHEQGAVHMAEGYARSTGKPGVVLVTSGPGATNAVTGLTDALMDSIPIVVLTGQVPTFMIGTDGFQEADTVGITRPCTKMNWLVKDTAKLSETIHQAFHVATHGRPGPVLIDIPKDVQFATADYTPAEKIEDHPLPAAHRRRPRPDRPPGRDDGKRRTPDPLHRRRRHQLRPARQPASARAGGRDGLSRHLHPDGPWRPTRPRGKNWVGMLGMHGLYEANLAMHGCDVMINIGARFDDRITGRIKDFSAPARRRRISTSTPPRSTRSSASMCRSSATSTKVLEEVAAPVARARQPHQQGGLAQVVDADQRMAGGEVPDLQELRPPRSNRNTRWNGWRP